MEDILFLKKEKVLTNRTIYIKIKGKVFKSIDILAKHGKEDALIMG